MKAFKYCTILVLPLVVYCSFISYGWLTHLPAIVFFGVVPLLEFFIKPNKENFTKKEEQLEHKNPIYSYILYATVPIQLFFLIFFLTSIQENGLTTFELSGRIFGMGIMCSVIGINVGHELGHRNNRRDEFLGELLLLTSLNTHFLPYHNGGHHFNVATPKDAATARKNEALYIFWFRSHFTSYLQAWSLENKRLRDSNRSWFHYQNRMIVYTICNIILLTMIYVLFGQFATIAFIIAAVIGIGLLETVNYIEHYGLLRKKNETRAIREGKTNPFLELKPSSRSNFTIQFITSF